MLVLSAFSVFTVSCMKVGKSLPKGLIEEGDAVELVLGKSFRLKASPGIWRGFSIDQSQFQPNTKYHAKYSWLGSVRKEEGAG